MSRQGRAVLTERTYIAIDLKSFYASVECVERGFDPLNTNLVVADESRTEKTIVLAASLSIMSEFELHKTKNRRDKKLSWQDTDSAFYHLRISA